MRPASPQCQATSSSNGHFATKYNIEKGMKGQCKPHLSCEQHFEWTPFPPDINREKQSCARKPGGKQYLSGFAYRILQMFKGVPCRFRGGEWFHCASACPFSVAWLWLPGTWMTNTQLTSARWPQRAVDGEDIATHLNSFLQHFNPSTKNEGECRDKQWQWNDWDGNSTRDIKEIHEQHWTTNKMKWGEKTIAGINGLTEKLWLSEVAGLQTIQKK